MSRLASLLLLIFTALVANQASSQPPTQPTFQYILCNFESATCSGDGPYEANLRAVLSTLHQQASTSAKFYSTSLGTDPDTVHGQFYCRRDIDSHLCSGCVQEAAQEALKTCGLAGGGIVWYEECTLRYSNRSMYGILDDPHPYSIAYSSAYVSSDPDLFSAAFSGTMDVLIQEAAVSSNLFATGEGKVSGSDVTVYSLVQCSPDLNAAQCDTCLRYVYFDAWTCCGHWPASLYAFYPSCQMMYNAEAAFYYSTPGAPNTPPPFVSSPPTPSPGMGSQPPPTSSVTAPSPSTVSQPPPPPSATAPSPSTVSQQPPPSSTTAPSPSTVSQPPPPSLAAPSPSTVSQPPSLSTEAPSPSKVSQPPPAPNSGLTIVRRKSMKFEIVTTTLSIFMMVMYP